MKRAVLLGILATTPVMSGFAQVAAQKAPAEFYVIVDMRTKKCTVVDKKPQVDSPSITVATDAIYKTKAEAERALPTLKPCT
jgi:hypothetical protein